MLAAAVAVPAAIDAAQAAGDARPGPGRGPLDGQPDIQGTWRPLIGGGRSLEDPGVPGGIEEEIARSQGKSKKNPSRVVDPPDGKVPYQPWAAALRQQQMDNEIGATRPEHIDTQARCLVLGAIRQSANANEFLQVPGFVVLVNEAYHNYRVIPVDGRPALPDTIKLWGGDSRGRWEGNTLVVEVRNLNGKNRLSHDGDFLSDTAAHRRALHVRGRRSHELRGDHRRPDGVHADLEDRASRTCARSSGRRTRCGKLRATRASAAPRSCCRSRSSSASTHTLQAHVTALRLMFDVAGRSRGRDERRGGGGVATGHERGMEGRGEGRDEAGG